MRTTEYGGRAARAIQAGFVLAMGGLWYAATEGGMVNPMVLPKLPLVGKELLQVLSTGEFVPHLLVTLGQIAASVGIASVLGLAIGFACSKSAWSIRVFDPLFSSLYAVPSILFYPLIVLFFGIGVPSKIAMGTIIAIFPIIMATMAGFASVDRVLQTAALSMGASQRDMFFRVLLPAALPVIASGLRIGMMVATGGTLASEALASFDGLGHMIVNLADQFKMGRMYAYLAITLVMALTITFTAFAIEKRFTRRMG